MSNLTILNNSIRQLDSLFCLNDLHSASGSEEKHRPSLFIRLDTTQELITELQKEVRSTDLIFKTLRGRNIQGTWACEELALAYATWISPKFHLVVLRAFIAMHKGEHLQNSQPKLPLVEEKADITITYKEAYWVAKYLVKARAFAKEVEIFHRKLHEIQGFPGYVRNDLAAKGHDLAHELNHTINPFIEQIFPETTQLKRLTNF